MKPVSEPSPLFDKMDALLARHRGSTAGTEEIPVLVDEADDIPVLTEEVNELWPDTEVLMFPPEEFMAASVAQTPTPTPEPAPAPPAPAPAEFLDLPLLDLDALSQANPWGADWEEEIIPPPALPETVSVLPAGDVLLPELNVADFALDEITPVIESSAVEEIELTAMPAAKVAQVIDFRQIAAKPLAPPAVPVPEAEILASSGPEAEILPVEAAAATTVLTEDAIAELTATVAAQLGVEIATEVEQLTRQHFASLMHRFYEDSLRQLTAEISQDMESRLQARVAALIKEELKKSGF